MLRINVQEIVHFILVFAWYQSRSILGGGGAGLFSAAFGFGVIVRGVLGFC